MSRMRVVQAVFAAALERSGAKRAEYLRRRCSGDAALLREVESLLSHYEAGEDFLERPAVLDVVGEVPQQPAAAVEKLPARVGSYEIAGVLGRGGMGVVYRARLSQPRREVALKVIRPGMSSARMLKRFAREMYVHMRLDHPGVARVYEVGMADGPEGKQPFLAMEYVHGLPLTEYARRRRLRWPACLNLLASVCDAVHHAHTRGVVHRDLKPANILVNHAGEPKLLDFGVARTADVESSLTAVGGGLARLIGTLPYMSPEQAAGCARPDARCDVYALGVIGFEMLAGRLPVETRGKKFPELVRAICDATPPRLRSIRRGIPAEVEAVIDRALAREASQRYQTAAELADGLRRAARSAPVAAPPRNKRRTRQQPDG